MVGLCGDAMVCRLDAGFFKGFEGAFPLENGFAPQTL